MHRAIRPLLVLPVLALAAIAGGCSSKGTLRPDLPPETTIFVQGPVDTVNHIAHLFWFGSDVDGDVTGFEYRILDTLQTGKPLDSLRILTPWSPTKRADSIFTFQTGQHRATFPVFEVRAVDNSGQVDPTPAVEDFKFSNLPPSMTLLGAPTLRDTTYFSLTLFWAPSDIDGDVTKMIYRVWWVDDSTHYRLTQRGVTRYTIPSSDFPDSTGPRVVRIQPIDDGGLAGPPVSATWYVRRPVTGSHARLLLVDDVPAGNPINPITQVDSLYYFTVAANVPAGTYSILRLEKNQPFKSAEDMAQTFKLFDAVLWYRGAKLSTTSSSPGGEIALFQLYGAGLESYLNAGGRFMLEAPNPFSTDLFTRGLMPDSYISRYLGSSGMFHYLPLDKTSVMDSSAAVSMLRLKVLQSPALNDSMVAQTAPSGMRGFVVSDASTVLFWANPGTLAQPFSIPLPVALDVPQPSGGQFILNTFPLRYADSVILGQNSRRLVLKYLQRLGVSP
jgi:hypothetical protein